MLAFTSDITAALEWFDATHQIATDFGRAYWLQTSLPAAGGAGDQDAWLMEALTVIREVKDQLLAESVKRSKDEQALKDWREKRPNGRT